MVTKNEPLLEQILKKLERIEKMLLDQSTPEKKNATTESSVLLEKLTHLTIKRHAVLTATLSGMGYQEIADIMKCDVTTVKLHLKAALGVIDVPSRSILLASHSNLLGFIPDKDYEKKFGLSKRWWLEQKPALMAVLTATKPTANQYKRA